MEIRIKVGEDSWMPYYVKNGRTMGEMLHYFSDRSVVLDWGNNFYVCGNEKLANDLIAAGYLDVMLVSQVAKVLQESGHLQKLFPRSKEFERLATHEQQKET